LLFFPRPGADFLCNPVFFCGYPKPRVGENRQATEQPLEICCRSIQIALKNKLIVTSTDEKYYLFSMSALHIMHLDKVRSVPDMASALSTTRNTAHLLPRRPDDENSAEAKVAMPRRESQPANQSSSPRGKRGTSRQGRKKAFSNKWNQM
jgi:hypothetical protein